MNAALETDEESDLRSPRPDPIALYLAAMAAPEEIGPAPCEGCRHRDRCATGLACAAFSLFVAYGTQTRWASAPRDPARAIYRRLFTDD